MAKIIGGSAFGKGDALIDTTGAVLLDSTSVAVVGVLRPTGAETTIALELGGRIQPQHTAQRSAVPAER